MGSESQSAVIYGLVNPRTGRIDYVGSSINLKSRLMHHFSNSRSRFHGKRSKFKVVILRQIEPSRRILIEHRIIRSLRAKRQCRFNWVIRRGVAVRCIHTGQVFISKSEARRMLGISFGALRTRVKDGLLVETWA